MCGITGYIGKKPAIEVILHGLSKLEYRGYDSSGISVIKDGKISFAKAVGKLTNLTPELKNIDETAGLGMGHTRWATHGKPTEKNAHPHVTEGLAIVHNGIIENYQELKESLIKSDIEFKSETDTEVILHLLKQKLDKDLPIKAAIIELLKMLEGAFSLGIISETEPGSIYLVKEGSPLVIGYGDGENFFASDAMALAEYTQKVTFLEDGDFVHLTKDKVEFFDFSGNKTKRKMTQLNWNSALANKQGYKHYMLKEIHDQPSVLSNAIQRLANLETEDFNESELGLNNIDTDKINRIHIVACGTSFYAGLVAKYAIEPLIKIPVEVELASEFRYREPALSDSTLIIPISQSGETADTLACVKYAKKFGTQILAICNVEHSSIPRESTSTLYMEAGPEIGVASTKAFTSMIFCLYMLSLALGKRKNLLSDEARSKVFKNLHIFPTMIDQTLGYESQVEDVASYYYEDTSCIFLGRGGSYPIALEGALKLKEISYIHAEGYPGGELKHGPIALIDKHMPICAIVPSDKYHDKMISNVEEVKARDGKIIGIGADNDKTLRNLSENYICCPQIEDETLQTILSVIPLQLFSYYIAIKRGTDIDQPRNLAKSVTVE